MPIAPVTFYEVRCDEPDCKATTGELSGEYAAWVDAGQARDHWVDSDGIVLEDGRTFCYDHTKGKVCAYCDAEADLATDDDGETLCPKCISEAPSPTD